MLSKRRCQHGQKMQTLTGLFQLTDGAFKLALQICTRHSLSQDWCHEKGPWVIVRAPCVAAKLTSDFDIFMLYSVFMRKGKILIRLRECAGCSDSFLSAHTIGTFSKGINHLTSFLCIVPKITYV